MAVYPEGLLFLLLLKHINHIMKKSNFQSNVSKYIEIDMWNLCISQKCGQKIKAIKT